jgi:malate dehydrogenase (oxaloacetate-decarboxylating)
VTAAVSRTGETGGLSAAPFAILRSGYEQLNDPLLSKGIAFNEAERDAFDLHGLPPPHVRTLDEQVARRFGALRGFGTDLERYDFLRDMQDNNETAFYALLTRRLKDTLPLVYTPTVGQGCQRFSQIYRKPHGLFLSLPNQERLAVILARRRVRGGRRLFGNRHSSADVAPGVSYPLA